MSVTYDRFKINSLIKMAKITQISEQRERYITLAEEELNKGEKLEINSIEMFLLSCIKPSIKSKALRTEVYEKYVDFCESKGYSTSTKNVLYRSIRENGFVQKKIHGDVYFGIDFINEKR